VKKNLVGLFIGLIIFSVWLYYIEIGTTLKNIVNRSFLYVFLGCLVFIISFFFKSLKWKFVLDATIKLPVLYVFRLHMTGALFNFIFPLRIGEIIKSVFLRKYKHVSMSMSLPTVLVDRVYFSIISFICLLFLPLITFDLNRYVEYGIFITLAISLIIIILVAISGFKTDLLIGLVRKFEFMMSKKSFDFIVSRIDIFFKSLKQILVNGTLFIKITFLTFLIICTDALTFYLLFYSINVRIDFIQFTVIAILMNLLYFVPSPPGSIGSTEWYFSLLFNFGLKISKEIVSSTAIIYHTLTSLIIIVIGLICVNTFKVQFKQVYKKVQTEDFQLNNGS